MNDFFRYPIMLVVLAPLSVVFGVFVLPAALLVAVLAVGIAAVLIAAAVAALAILLVLLLSALVVEGLVFCLVFPASIIRDWIDDGRRVLMPAGY